MAKRKDLGEPASPCSCSLSTSSSAKSLLISYSSPQSSREVLLRSLSPLVSSWGNWDQERQRNSFNTTGLIPFFYQYVSSIAFFQVCAQKIWVALVRIIFLSNFHVKKNTNSLHTTEGKGWKDEPQLQSFAHSPRNNYFLEHLGNTSYFAPFSLEHFLHTATLSHSFLGPFRVPKAVEIMPRAQVG